MWFAHEDAILWNSFHMYNKIFVVHSNIYLLKEDLFPKLMKKVIGENKLNWKCF